MNTSKYMRNDNNIKNIIDECRKGNYDKLLKLYNTYYYILRGYMSQNKKNISLNDKRKLEEYFFDSIKLFVRYEYGYDLVPYIYNRLSLLNKDKPLITNIDEEIKAVITPKTNHIIEKYYKKYYYIIKEYVKDYDYYLKQDAVIFAQDELKKAIEKITKFTDAVTEEEIKKHFNNFDYKFKQDLGNVEIVLDDIKNGKDDYINIILDKYKSNIEKELNNTNSTDNDRKVYETFLKRIVNFYNKDLLKLDYSINLYITRCISDIGKELKYNKKRLDHLINLIIDGKTEYIYAVYDFFKYHIDKSLSNTKYDKTIMKKYIEKVITDSVNDYILNIQIYDIKKLQKKITRKLQNTDRTYYLYINKIPNINVKKSIQDIRDGKYELIDNLINYYKNRIKLLYKYPNAENDVIDNILFKLINVDINKYLFNGNYKFSFSLSEYILKNTALYKEILDNYINSIQNLNVDLQKALVLSKSDKKYVYMIYKIYEAKIDAIIAEILDIEINTTYKKMKNNILYNSIKNYVESESTDKYSVDELNRNICADFLWLKDIDKEINTKTK